jgi:hypothetical protein
MPWELIGMHKKLVQQQHVQADIRHKSATNQNAMQLQLNIRE